MSDPPQSVHEPFENQDVFEPAEGGYRVTTTVFDANVTVSNPDGETNRYTVTVRTPMLGTAVKSDRVGDAVESGWFETFERRLEDAPKATRASINLESYSLTDQSGQAVATYEFEYDNPTRAVEIAKTLVEYVEGTYAEGIVPGYTYRSPVADLLQGARTDTDEHGGTPL